MARWLLLERLKKQILKKSLNSYQMNESQNNLQIGHAGHFAIKENGRAFNEKFANHYSNHSFMICIFETF